MNPFSSLKTLILKHVERPIIKFFLFSILDTFVGALGMLLYGIFTSTYGPVWIRNQFFGLWLTTLIFFIGLQSIYIEIKTWRKKFIYFYDLVYFILYIIVSFLMVIFYGMSKRIDAIIWSIYIFAVCLTNVYILYARRSNLKQQIESEPKINNKSYVESTSENLTDRPETQQLNTNPNQLKPAQKRSKLNRCLIMTCRVVNVILRFLFLLFACFLLAGAITEGVGNAKYPARGKFADVNYGDGRTIKVHYLCDGPVNSNQPVIMFEGSASHGLADYLSLQKLLKENNRRSCIWDKPGNGYSDYLYTGFKDYINIYHNMLTSFGENKPFALVGWGGGGLLIYHYAYEHPEMVKSLTFLDVAPANIEFKIPAELKNWTQAQLDDYKNKEFASREALIKIINGLGVPWGLMSIFFPGLKTYYSEFNQEATWYFLTEKTWITQELFLKLIRNEVDYFETLKINQTIPVNVLMSYKSDQQIIDQVCKKRNYASDSSDCVYEINSNKISIRERAKLVNLSTAGGKLINCTMDDCDLGYFVELGANYTVFNLLNNIGL